MEITKRNVQKLLKKGDQLFESTLALVKAREKDSPIILFGAGEGGLKMKTLLESEGVTVSFFTDNASNKWGAVASGVPILSPREALSVPDAFFVISASDEERISRQLRISGVRAIEDCLYVMYRTLSCRRVFLKHLGKLKRVRSLLHDIRSLKTFDALLAQTFTLDPSLLLPVYEPNQYFFDNHFTLHAGETMVDAGAFTGDTVAEVVKRFGRRFKAIHCFEPNSTNFRALSRFVMKEGLTKKVILHNCGLSNHRDIAYFSGSGLGYHVTTEGDPSRETVPTMTIDDVFTPTPIRRGLVGGFTEERVDFIKMDIEGAEPLALAGALKVIRRDHPRLAICMYHTPEHFYEIPLMLARMVPNYSFFLRHHSLGRDETVWYARKKK